MPKILSTMGRIHFMYTPMKTMNAVPSCKARSLSMRLIHVRCVVGWKSSTSVSHKFLDLGVFFHVTVLFDLEVFVDDTDAAVHFEECAQEHSHLCVEVGVGDALANEMLQSEACDDVIQVAHTYNVLSEFLNKWIKQLSVWFVNVWHCLP